MRVTQSMYYKNLYGQNNSQLQSKLFDVNKQIASGLKIQYAHDDVLTFSDTMRLDNEITTLGQIQKSTDSGYKVSNQTDSILNDFTQSLSRTKTLMIQAKNDTQSIASRNAIAAELRGLEGHFKNLANTSINGQFIFAGTAVGTKPIADDGTYRGNNQSMNAFLGSGIQQNYNLSGADLFLGEESLVQRQVTTNIEQYNLSARYPDFTNSSSDENGLKEVITTEDTIRDLMGAISDSPNMQSHFYIRGTKSSGEAFSKQVSMNDSETVGELLTQIGNAFGNTSDVDLVNVSLDPLGNILIEDKIKGSSKLDFHMVAAIDFDLSDGDDADINSSVYGVTAGNIDHLAAGETDFNRIIKGTSSAENDMLHVKKFIQSSHEATSGTSHLISAKFVMDRAVEPLDTLSITVDNGDGTVTPYTQVFSGDTATTYSLLKTQIELTGDFTVSINGDTVKLNITHQGIENGVSIDTALANDDFSTVGAVSVGTTIFDSSVPTDNNALLYSRTMFSKDGSTLNSTTPQILKSTNAFATNATKISEVADLSQGTAGTLSGTQFKLEGNSTSGNAYSAVIDFKNTASGGSTFSFDGGVTDYKIFNVSTPRTAVDADEMTYRQLMDVVNMLATGNIPTSTTDAADYDEAIEKSTLSAQTSLSYDGKITFTDLQSSTTKANISMYDAGSGSFSATTNASVLTFNSNNALTISDPKTDFFKRLDEIITAVEENKMHPDGTSGNYTRSVGMSNALTMIDDLANHVGSSQSQVGANSNALLSSLERTTLLETSTKILRSSVVEIDLAEASLHLTQLSLNYEAMLSTVGKVSKLSLVNYL
ncbi:MAG: flagellar hook-associated protein 3 FlgL [Sulfurimonas sp.]|jgi:flagellar hook-associated protein 3 FlgL|uniref:flagellin N-terminal helical domain-containing protein n=1 Tax=Sulfurimonas sp. TaxID=2022749 RepID=UPI0039E483C9